MVGLVIGYTEPGVYYKIEVFSGRRKGAEEPKSSYSRLKESVRNKIDKNVPLAVVMATSSSC